MICSYTASLTFTTVPWCCNNSRWHFRSLRCSTSRTVWTTSPYLQTVLPPDWAISHRKLTYLIDSSPEVARDCYGNLNGDVTTRGRLLNCPALFETYVVWLNDLHARRGNAYCNSFTKACTSKKKTQKIFFGESGYQLLFFNVIRFIHPCFKGTWKKKIVSHILLYFFSSSMIHRSKLLKGKLQTKGKL